jgi:hypothetical protein
MTKKPYRTAKQRELMGIILAEAGEGRFLNFQTLHAKISYGASYGAVRTSIRFLVKAEMVTKEVFSSLEGRVVELENLASSGGGLQSGQISWMQQQVNRFDPANKSLTFGNMKGTDVSKRVAEIQKFFQDQANDPTIINFDHVWKGKAGNRSLTPITIVEFASRDVRETVLKKIEAGSKMSVGGNEISIRRNKTAWQLKRNAALFRAEEALKKDSRVKDQNLTVKIVMMDPGDSKDRWVEVSGRKVFIQKIGNMSGTLQAPFLHVSL